MTLKRRLEKLESRPTRFVDNPPVLIFIEDGETHETALQRVRRQNGTPDLTKDDAIFVSFRDRADMELVV